MSELHLVERSDARQRPAWLVWLSTRTEHVTAILLAVAALATAWSSYQASIWGGIQSAQYNMSSGLRTRATRAADEAARMRMLDIGLFTKWLEAYADNRSRLAAFYELHFRPEFRPAFVAWRGSDPMLTSAASRTPFELPEYRLASASAAEKLDVAATRAFDAGQNANNISDGYVFDTVILASVLFFAGAIRPLVSSRLRWMILGIAIALCAWAITRLAEAPVAR